MKKYDVAVIGGGVHGLFTAYALSKRNLAVILCEQYEFGHLRGSSHDATRIFKLSYENIDYVRMAMNARTLWRQFEDDAQVSLIEQNGCVDQGSSEQIAQRVNAMDQAGVVSEVLSKEEASYRWPNIEFEDTVFFHPGGGRIYARATLSALYERCLAQGVELQDFTEIKNIKEQGKNNVVLETDDSSFAASCVVVAAGAWLPNLLGDQMNLPKMKISQEQTLYFQSKDPGAIWPNMMHHRNEMIFYSQEAPGVGIAVGGIRMGTYIDNIEDRDFVVDPLVAINVCDYVAEFMPGLIEQPISSNTCVATFNKSDDFLLDKVGDIVVISACQQKGFSFAPLIGKQAADLVTGTNFPPLRFRFP